MHCNAMCLLDCSVCACIMLIFLIFMCVNVLYNHTGSLESFHNIALAYAPKRSPFQYVVIYVSCMHTYYTLLFRN